MSTPAAAADPVRAGPSPLQVVLRLLVGVPGAYAFGWSYTAFAAVALVHAGIARSEAVAWATLTSYAVMLGSTLAAVSMRRLWPLALAMGVLGALMFAGARLMGRP